MLLKEYTIDPELFAQPHLIKQVIRDFGIDKGRILSLAPKDWMRMAFDSLNQNTATQARKEAEVLISTLHKWKLQKIAIRSPARKNTAYQSPWISFLQQFQQNPFDGVLTMQESNWSIHPDAVWQEPEAWRVENTITVNIEARQYLPLLNRLFNLSETIYVIDPYFNLEDSRYWSFWEIMAEMTKANPHIKNIIFITGDHKAPCQIVGRNPERLSANNKAEIYSLAVNQIDGGMHDRFVLTDIAGFGFTNSFQDKADEKMEISRLSQKSYGERLKQYEATLTAEAKVS